MFLKKLADNPEFISELSEKSPEVVKEMVEKYPIDKLIEVNPNLINDPEFIAEAVEKDRAAVVEYIRENKNSLEMSQIDTVRETVKNDTEKDFMKLIDENAEKSTDERFKKVQTKIAECGENNPLKMKWITAMATIAETVEPEKVTELVDYLSTTMIKLERLMKENPDREISLNEAHQLVTPQILSGLIEKAQIKEMSQNMEQTVEEYTKFYEEFHGKFMEQKQERINQPKQQEHNAKLCVNTITLTVNNKGIEEVITYDRTMSQGIELTPEQMKQLENDLADRNLARENIQEVVKTKTSQNRGQDR